MRFREIFVFLLLSLMFISLTSSTNIEAGTNYWMNKVSLNDYPVDNYADDFIEWASLFVFDGDNALGAPDGVYANAYQGYAPGVITLDLGKYETAINDSGDDIIVHSNSGEYLVKIGNDLSLPFTSLGAGNGTLGFDFDTIGFEDVRFVQIQCTTEHLVALDAIEVMNVLPVTVEDDDPVIEGYVGLENLWTWENASLISFSWLVSDSTPYNYSISVNDSEIESDYWEEDSINFEWDDIVVGNLTITLKVWDYFGNTVEDTVLFEIRSLPANTNAYVLFAIFPIILLSFIHRKRNKSNQR